MVEHLWKSDIVEEGEEKFSVGEKEEESDGEDEKESVHERHLEIERADRVDEWSEEDIVRGEEESGDIRLSDGEKSFGKSEESDGDIGWKCSEDEEDRVRRDTSEEHPEEILCLEKNVYAKEDDGESDLDADAIGDADFRCTAEEREEATDKSADTIEFIETPVARATGNVPVEQWRGQDDEEAEEEDISSGFDGRFGEMGE